MSSDTMHPLLKILRSSPALPELVPSWRSQYLELTYAKRPVGYIPRRLEWMIEENPHLFTSGPQGASIALKEGSQKELDEFVANMFKKKVFTGWRNELYPGRALDGHHEQLFTVERAFAKVFGLFRQSIHVNGYTFDKDGKIQYWMGKRSASKSRFPGMLDNVVAGGMPVGYTPFECAVKECHEEASLTETVSRKRLRSTGSITRVCQEEGFLALEEIFIFDMNLEGITPKPSDGEVESFTLVDCAETLLKRSAEVKPDVLIIMIDFMLRHGLVNPDSNPDGYLQLVRALHAPIPLHIQSTRSPL